MTKFSLLFLAGSLLATTSLVSQVEGGTPSDDFVRKVYELADKREYEELERQNKLEFVSFDVDEKPPEFFDKVESRTVSETPLAYESSENGRIMSTLLRMEKKQSELLEEIERLRSRVEALENRYDNATRLAPKDVGGTPRVSSQPTDGAFRTATIDPAPGTSEYSDYRWVVHPQTGIPVPAQNEWISYSPPGSRARILELVRYRGKPVILKSVIHGQIRGGASGGRSSSPSPQQGLNMNFGQ